MYIFEITIPGVWLDYEDRDWCWKIEGLLRHLESQFFEANTALNLFATHRISFPERDRSQWEAEMHRRSEIRQQVEKEIGGNWEQREAVDFETEKIFKHESWHKGNTPRALEDPKPFIFARAFLYALDSFDKFLSVLSKETGVPQQIEQLSAQVEEAFPHLRKVRNSAQHLEDRARGLGAGRTPKPLDLKPVVTGMISAPNGGLLILNSLNGSRYGCTMADGHYGEVDVSPESMQKLQQIIEKAFACFKWKGAKRHLPN